MNNLKHTKGNWELADKGYIQIDKDTTQNIHNIVSKHIVSFGQYEYKPTIKN